VSQTAGEICQLPALPFETLLQGGKAESVCEAGWGSAVSCTHSRVKSFSSAHFSNRPFSTLLMITSRVGFDRAVACHVIIHFLGPVSQLSHQMPKCKDVQRGGEASRDCFFPVSCQSPHQSQVSTIRSKCSTWHRSSLGWGRSLSVPHPSSIWCLDHIISKPVPWPQCQFITREGF
jgi:hypothetical protein